MFHLTPEVLSSSVPNVKVSDYTLKNIRIIKSMTLAQMIFGYYCHGLQGSTVNLLMHIRQTNNIGKMKKTNSYFKD